MNLAVIIPMNDLDTQNLHCLGKCEFLYSIAFSFAVKIIQSEAGETAQLAKHMIPEHERHGFRSPVLK